MNKKILQLAIPSIISNITVPLLGLIDVAIVGHLGAASYIGAIAVGGMFFSIIYWLFGFLRMGTSGMTAQAFGKRDFKTISDQLFRALLVALMVSFLLLLSQRPIESAIFKLITTSEDVRFYASLYFRICIWGAPAVLGLYVFSGWFIGMQNSKFPMYIAIVQNLINIIISFLFVFGFGMKVEGVAWGTLIAQYAGLFIAILFWYHYYKRIYRPVQKASLLAPSAMIGFFKVNIDIFLRTLCLVCVTTYFTKAGARQGDTILAVNTLLLQLFTLFSYIMDGFAYAGEALTGRFVGAKNRKGLKHLIRLLFRWGFSLAFLFTLLYGLGGYSFLRLLTNNSNVLHSASPYFCWVIAIPMAGFAAFLWDGILIGATATRYMLYGMIIASGAFFALYFLCYSSWMNHALWGAFIVYLLLRGLMQWYFWNKCVLKKVG